MSDAGVHVKLEDRAEGRIAARHGRQRRQAQLPVDPADRRPDRAFAELGEDEALRAVVLTGAGDRAFIGGADLNELGGLCADSARLFITRLH